MPSIAFDDLLQARQRIAGLVRQTPLEHSPSLSRLLGVPV
ncbi:MAG: hydroxyectoine utilization dehydratase EutB, partial [Betaproteobacteria bacterium]|nr:hydroxyectoine utilization dehydratase EutB [Betaproteobacteria bacterium]